MSDSVFGPLKILNQRWIASELRSEQVKVPEDTALRRLDDSLFGFALFDPLSMIPRASRGEQLLSLFPAVVLKGAGIHALILPPVLEFT